MADQDATSGFRILPFTIKREARTSSGCEHLSVELDEQTHLVVCCKCGRSEDAFAYLWRLATKAQYLAKWYEEFNRINRLRREVLNSRRDGESPTEASRWWTERPPATAKASCALWDRIVSETGAPPPALSKSLTRVMSEEVGTKLYSDAGISYMCREYSVEEWIANARKPQAVRPVIA